MEWNINVTFDATLVAIWKSIKSMILIENLTHLLNKNPKSVVVHEKRKSVWEIFQNILNVLNLFEFFPK